MYGKTITPDINETFCLYRSRPKKVEKATADGKTCVHGAKKSYSTSNLAPCIGIIKVNQSPQWFPSKIAAPPQVVNKDTQPAWQ